MRFLLALMVGMVLNIANSAAQAHGGWGFSYHYAPPPPPCYHYCPAPYYPPPVVHHHFGGYHGHYHGHHGHRPRVGLFFGF